MSIAKRFSVSVIALAMTAAMVLGSLSFSFAFTPTSEIDSSIPLNPNVQYSYILTFLTSDTRFVSGVLSSSEPLTRVYTHSPTYTSTYFKFASNAHPSTLSILLQNPSSGYRLITDSLSSTDFTTYQLSSWFNAGVRLGGANEVNGLICIGCSDASVDIDRDSSSSSYPLYLIKSVKPPISSVPVYWDFMPFFFPELPHGYFDGNINVVDGIYNIDFPSNASISGDISQTGNDHYTWVWDSGSVYWYGDTVQDEHEGWLSPTYQGQTPPGGDITQTYYANRLISLSLSDLDSVVNYTPAYSENSRFRCWSCVMDSSYVWFISDTRNKITGSIVSVTSDEVTWKYEFADPQGGNTIYPTWAIVFSPMGEVIQVLSPITVSNKNTYTLSCSIGTLEQDQDTGIWSCDPLYHGFWFSDDSPPVQGITSLQVAENKKVLANPVFGEEAFTLNFLNSINDNLTGIRSDISSLQSAMQSSISGQTSAFENMDAPSAEQPSTSNMMDYFAQESAFNAPDTSSMFSGDIKTGHAWQGVTWWSSKFNDIIVANDTIVGFTTAMLTLGLAVMIIGRRFSMR